MIPQREFDNIQEQLIRTLCDLKGWTITRGQFYEIMPLVDQIVAQITCATESDILARDDYKPHTCGLTGYNGMIDPPCPGCADNYKRGKNAVS